MLLYSSLSFCLDTLSIATVTRKREFQKKFSSQQNQKKLEQIYQEKENFIKNYSNLLQDDKIAITNLHQLFEILANRAGFEKEWERYHRES